MVRVLFTALGTCMSSCASFPVVSIFLAFEAPLGYWDTLFNLLKIITDFHFLGSMGLIKNQDFSVSLDLFSAIFNGDSSDVCHSLFSQSCCLLLWCSQGQLPTSDNSLGRVQSFVEICFTFGSVEYFYFHLEKQVSISCCLYVFGVTLIAITFSIRKGENLVKQTSWKDSMTMHLGNSVPSFSVSDSDKFL